MSLSRSQHLAKTLAGTVTFPPTFPQLAVLSLVTSTPPVHRATQTSALRVEQPMSPQLTIVRTVDLNDVSAVFIPRDPRCVNLNDGTWLIGAEEIAAHLTIQTHNASGRSAYGIAYLPEHAPVFMQVEVGMTAAESAEYYPPLACERTHNHYELPHERAAERVRVPNPIRFCECEGAPMAPYIPTQPKCEGAHAGPYGHSQPECEGAHAGPYGHPLQAAPMARAAYFWCEH